MVYVQIKGEFKRLHIMVQTCAHYGLYAHYGDDN